MPRSLFAKLALAVAPLAIAGSLAMRWLLLQEAVGGLRWERALAVGAAMAAVLAFAAWAVLHPVRALARDARRVARGEYPPTVRIKSRDELGEIARSVNALSTTIVHHRQELFYLNQAVREIAEAGDLPSLGPVAVEVLERFIPSRHIAVARIEGGRARTLFSRDFEARKDLPLEFGPEDSLILEVVKRHSAFAVARGDLGGDTAMPGEEILAAPVSFEGPGEGMACLLSGPRGEATYRRPDIDRAEFISGAVAARMRSIAAAERQLAARDLEAELATAELVQRTLIPRLDLKLPGFAACGFSVSASKTCGDWYGYIDDRERHRVVVVIGDVTGHGVPSALVASAANSFLRTMAQVKDAFYGLEIVVRQVQREIESASKLELERSSFDPLNPSRLLQYLNSNILGTVERALEMSFFASTYDLERRELSYASAGHEPPLVWRAAGAEHPFGRARSGHVECLLADGVRLGDRENPTFRLFRTWMAPGDAILYYTDGLTDCVNGEGEEFGSSRLIQLLDECGGSGVETIQREIAGAVEEFREGEPLADDLSFVVTKCL